MDYKAFQQLLSQGSLPSVLLFQGEEDYLKRAAWQALRKAFLPEGLEELNEAVLDAPAEDELIAAAETVPFMADRRLLLVRDLPALTGKAEASDHLLEYLQQVPDSTLMVLYCTQKPDARKKIVSQLKKANATVDFSPLKNRDLTSFVIDSFRELGKSCDEPTAEFLIFTCGDDAHRLRTEIAKLASYHPEAPAIQPEEIRELATPSSESSVFRMIDAVVSGQASLAFSLLHQQLRNGEDRMALLALLLRQYRILQHIKILQRDGASRDVIQTALGIAPFVLNQDLRQASSYTGPQIREAVALCLDTDFAVKSGRLNADGALEAVILKLLNIRKKD